MTDLEDDVFGFRLRYHGLGLGVGGGNRFLHQHVDLVCEDLLKYFKMEVGGYHQAYGIDAFCKLLQLRKGRRSVTLRHFPGSGRVCIIDADKFGVLKFRVDTGMPLSQATDSNYANFQFLCAHDSSGVCVVESITIKAMSIASRRRMMASRSSRIALPDSTATAPIFALRSVLTV